MDRFIPLSIPNFEGNEKEYVDNAVEQCWVSTGGAYVTELENRISSFIKADKTAACQSGTSAIHLALIECGVGPGDTVIVPTLTFIAAVNPVKYQFADTVFMDCDESLCIDPVKLEAFCEEECDFKDNKLIFRKTGSHIKALIVVHVFGNMADMENIMRISEKYNFKVIEDATEALGTRYTSGKYSGKFAGTLGDFGAYSFNGNKIITTGGGGAVTAKDPLAVEHMRYLSTQAKDDPCFYIHNEVGYNYRMTNIQAALGVAQMEELPEFIERKHRNFELYRQLLADCDNVRILKFREGTYSNKWFYSLEIDHSVIKNTNLREIVAAFSEKGVQTRSIWGLIHQQKPYLNSYAYKIEKAVYYNSCILNIPCSTQLSREDIEYTAEIIKSVLK